MVPLSKKSANESLFLVPLTYSEAILKDISKSVQHKFALVLVFCLVYLSIVFEVHEGFFESEFFSLVDGLEDLVHGSFKLYKYQLVFSHHV